MYEDDPVFVSLTTTICALGSDDAGAGSRPNREVIHKFSASSLTTFLYVVDHDAEDVLSETRFTNEEVAESSFLLDYDLHFLFKMSNRGQLKDFLKAPFDREIKGLTEKQKLGIRMFVEQ